MTSVQTNPEINIHVKMWKYNNTHTLMTQFIYRLQFIEKKVKSVS